jgi:hypothetical protein
MFNSFLSLFLIYNYGKNNFINKNVVNDTLIITNENNMNNLGLCEIPFNDDIEDDLMKISEYFYKSKLLKTLENPNVSIYDKLLLIERENILGDQYTVNILKGLDFEDFFI